MWSLFLGFKIMDYLVSVPDLKDEHRLKRLDTLSQTSSAISGFISQQLLFLCLISPNSHKASESGTGLR